MKKGISSKIILFSLLMVSLDFKDTRIKTGVQCFTFITASPLHCHSYWEYFYCLVFLSSKHVFKLIPKLFWKGIHFKKQLSFECQLRFSKIKVTWFLPVKKFIPYYSLALKILFLSHPIYLSLLNWISLSYTSYLVEVWPV